MTQIILSAQDHRPGFKYSQGLSLAAVGLSLIHI